MNTHDWPEWAVRQREPGGIAIALRALDPS